MAFFTETQNSRPSVLATVLQFFSTVGSSIDLAASSHARMRRMEQLSALSDGQLASRGLRREDIARHVFRDVLHH